MDLIIYLFLSFLGFFLSIIFGGGVFYFEKSYWYSFDIKLIFLRKKKLRRE